MPISIKIGQHLLKLCTQVCWCFYAPGCIDYCCQSAVWTSCDCVW